MIDIPENVPVPVNKANLYNLNDLEIVKKGQQKGDPGANIFAYSAKYSNEYILQLQGRQGSLNYAKMSLGDDQVGMIMSIYKNPIKSANWDIPIPEDGTDKERKAIEALKEWMFNKAPITFSVLLSQVLSFLEFGFSSFEILWVPFKFEGVTYLMPELHQRMQTSIENIYPDKGYLEQSTVNKGLVQIPLEEMLFFTLNQQGLDLRGTSLLRNSFSNWKEKLYYKTFEGIGIQRSQTGIPTMVIPEGTDIDSSDYKATEALLKNITCHEDAYMIIPKGFEFTIETFKNDPSKIHDIIDKLDEKMAISVLSQFILLGTGGGGGAYALSRDQSDMFLDGLIYIVNYIEQQIHRVLITPYVEYNFGNSIDSKNIMLKGLNINKKTGQELAETLTKLSASGFIKATLDDEKQMRQYLELPKLSEEELLEREENKKKMEDVANNPPVIPIVDDKKKKLIKLTESKTKSRKILVTTEEDQLKDVMKGNLLLIKDKLMADIRSVLNKGTIEIKGLKNIDVSWSKYAKNLERKMSGVANKGWNDAKKDAKKNIKLSEPMNSKNLSDKELRQYVINESQSLAEDQVTSMKINAILTASNSPLKGYSNDQTMSNVSKVIDNFIEGQKVATGASLMTVGALNFGETQFYKEIEDQLWGYRFVAVDDGNTSDICKWYGQNGGKTFSINSTELTEAAPPLHPNCRSYLEPIYKDDVKNKPKIEDEIAPPSVRKQKSVY